jgi:starch phosphorylase
VEAVYGRVDETDAIVSPSYQPLTPGDPLEDGRLRYVADIPLEMTGSFGYSVRVVPHHPNLAARTELGLVAVPPAHLGMTSGPLR